MTHLSPAPQSTATPTARHRRRSLVGVAAATAALLVAPLLAGPTAASAASASTPATVRAAAPQLAAAQARKAAPAVGVAYWASTKKVRKSLLSGAAIKSAARSAAIIAVSTAKAKTLGSKKSGILVVELPIARTRVRTDRTGAIPDSISVAQHGAQAGARAELAHLKLTLNYKKVAVSSTSLTIVGKLSGVRIGRTILVTGSAVITAQCRKPTSTRASNTQLRTCSQRIAKAQLNKSKNLFKYAPRALATLIARNQTTPPIMPFWTTDTEPYCAQRHSAGWTTWAWCAANLLPARSGNVTFDSIQARSVNGRGTVTTGMKDGSLRIYYTPKDNGPFTDEIRYTLRNSSYGIVSNEATITITYLENS